MEESRNIDSNSKEKMFERVTLAHITGSNTSRNRPLNKVDDTSSVNFE